MGKRHYIFKLLQIAYDSDQTYVSSIISIDQETDADVVVFKNNLNETVTGRLTFSTLEWSFS